MCLRLIKSLDERILILPIRELLEMLSSRSSIIYDQAYFNDMTKILNFFDRSEL